MAEKDPPRVKFLEVKPAADVTDDDINKVTPKTGNNHDDVRNKFSKEQNKSKFFPVPPHTRSVHETEFAKFDRSFHEVELKFANKVKEAKEVKIHDSKEGKDVEPKTNENSNVARNGKSKQRKLKKNSVLPLDVTQKDKEKFEDSTKDVDVGETDCRNDKKKKTKKGNGKSKKKKKKGLKNPVVETQSTLTTSKEPEEQKVQLTEATNRMSSDEVKSTDEKNKTRKLPCCFGFVATWLAKRKQKRRDKKRKAIANRSTLPNLVQYEHKKTRGGEAFVIEVDTKPVIKKPLLPPIKQTAGPIRRGTDDRLQTAEKRRAVELAKRKAAAETYERKRTKCKAKKSELDVDFRNKTDLNIRFKQADAERNRYNLSRRTRTATRPRPVSSIQSPSCESMSIEGDPCAFIDDDNDPDAWRVDDVDIFSY
ncbi:uncharacterized protein LOC123547990 [Mercenaria mercenaria]|uniref:uncharacterized protein LOC123547990 n=1 Tax=Mercenaria mercenaria TaxID=6596 RepID=UPI00234F7815|nr:uncharacterized protein LOC123547990 [Mercenaria mercenaria]